MLQPQQIGLILKVEDKWGRLRPALTLCLASLLNLSSFCFFHWAGCDFTSFSRLTGNSIDTDRRASAWKDLRGIFSLLDLRKNRIKSEWCHGNHKRVLLMCVCVWLSSCMFTCWTHVNAWESPPPPPPDTLSITSKNDEWWMRLHKASNNNNYCQNNDGQKNHHLFTPSNYSQLNVPVCPVETNEDEQGTGLSWRKFATCSA